MSDIKLISAVCLVDADGRVLLSQRPTGKSMAGKWEFPGGKIETGETPEDTLIRELGEELGIDTHSSCLAPLCFVSHAYSDWHMVLMLYVCRRWQGTPAPQEGNDIIWVRPQRLRDYDMPDANRELISAIQDLLN